MPRTGASQVDRLADTIHERVISGELGAGAWLRQDHLASEFAVSRTPIREALQTLNERGVVELLPHRGARVRLPSSKELREAYEVRAELEGLAVERAASLATQDQLDQLRSAEQLFAMAVEGVDGDPGGADEGRRRWEAANDSFHEVIHVAAHNELLRDTLAGLHRRFPRNLTWGALDDLRLLRENVAQHREIREALELHDRALARAAMRRHVARSAELLIARLPDFGHG